MEAIYPLHLTRLAEDYWLIYYICLPIHKITDDKRGKKHF